MPTPQQTHLPFSVPRLQYSDGSTKPESRLNQFYDSLQDASACSIFITAKRVNGTSRRKIICNINKIAQSMCFRISANKKYLLFLYVQYIDCSKLSEYVYYLWAIFSITFSFLPLSALCTEYAPKCWMGFCCCWSPIMPSPNCTVNEIDWKNLKIKSIQ